MNLFVNTAWTTSAKVPKTTPLGEELVYGTNAFPSLSAASAYAYTHPGTYVYHDFDKEVTLDNYLGLPALRSQEIKPTFKEDMTKNSYAAYSKIAPTGTIKVTVSPVDLELSGYKSVTINPTTNVVYTVLGGNNQIAHTFNQTYGKNYVMKESATVAGKADGTLTLNGTAQVMAVGVYASAYGMYNDSILPTDSAFKFADPGDPWDPAWGTSYGTVLSALPGYANATIKNGTALALVGGTLNYARIADATYALDYVTLLSLNKSCSSGTAATGALTIDSGFVNLASNYAAVKVYGVADFTELAGGTKSDSAKTTYTYTPGTLTKKATSEYSSAFSATGSVEIGDIDAGYGARGIYNYAKVTVGNARLGDLEASNVKDTEKETSEIVSSGTAKEKTTATHSSSYQIAGGGTLTAAKGAYWARLNDVTGFTNVNLVGATVVSGMIAACYYGAPYSRSETASSTVSGYSLQSKYTSKYTGGATGTVTLKGSIVSSGIFGYQTLKLTDTIVSTGIEGGKFVDDETETRNRSEKNGVVTSTYASQYKSTGTAFGALTMAGGSLKTASITNYATVTLDHVAGDVAFAKGGNATREHKLTMTSVGGVETLYDSSYAYNGAAAGTLTVNNGNWLTISGLSCFSKVTMNGGKLVGDIDYGWSEKNTMAEKRTSDTKKDIRNLADSSYLSQGPTGSVSLTDVVGDAAYVFGYQAIALDGTTVKGVDSGYAHVESNMNSKELTDGGGTTLKSAWGVSRSWTPNTVLTLKNGASATTDALGIKTLNLDAALIGGDVGMVGSRYLASATYNSNGGKFTSVYVNQETSSACGTVTASNCNLGNIFGAAKVTATDTSFGNLTGGTFTSDYKLTSNNVSSSFSDSSASSATATATLTGVVAGGLGGYGNVKLNSAAAIAFASAGNTKTSYSETSATAAYSQSYSSEYNVAGALTAAPDAAVGYDVEGYATVTLDSASIGGSVGSARVKFTEDLKKTFTSDGLQLTNQTYTSEYVYAPATTLSLKNVGAFVGGAAYGIKTLNLGAGNVAVYGDVDMESYNSKITDKITYNQKTGVYEEKREVFIKQSAAGTVTAVDYAVLDGYVTGAAKVTLTDTWLSSDTAATNVTESRSMIARGPVVSGSFNASAWVGLDHATEVTSQLVSSGGAAGNFTLTRGQAEGIRGYAAVKLTGAIVGHAFAGTHKDTATNVYKNGIDTLTSVYSSGVVGTLTATDVSFTDTTMVVGGFATVTLTDCDCAGGNFYGGSYEETRSGTGNGVTYDAASTYASNHAVTDYVEKAAGTFTAVRTDLGGTIYDYATVNLTDCTGSGVSATYDSSVKTTLTLAGANTFTGGVNGVNNVTVKSGDTVIDGYSGTDGNDTFTVNAGAAVQVGFCYFNDGTDKAVINGTLRLFGILSYTNKLAISGSGVIAVKDSDYATAKAQLDGIMKGVTLVNGGMNDSTVAAIRTRKEELADNKASGARKFAGDSMSGWLSGEEYPDYGMFADTEDWIKFKFESGCDYDVTLDDDIRHNDVAVEVWRGGTKLQDVAWTGGKFDLDETAFAADTDYQLRLTIDDNKAALAYYVNKA